MSDSSQPPSGPDLAAGVPLSDLPDGTMLAGHVGDKPVLLVRRGEELFAIGARCTHYSAPLGDGLLVGETVRCPWHHACFDLRTGEAVRAPALDPVARWEVERRDGRVRVTRELPAADGATPSSGRRPAGAPPESVVIVGAGAAGNAAAEMLRREGYDGPVTMVGADPAAPYDRPNLSKDYLAGTASEDWIPLRQGGFYAEHRIDLLLGRRERFAVAPFFWSNHYDVSVNYVGHAERWDDLRVDGDVAAGDCEVSYVLGGKTLAVVTVGRDRANLEAEVAMERAS
jgi:3-phenylpropionate/trans-cinnamate dioxygenase ferredoxin reductase subunit